MVSRIRMRKKSTHPPIDKSAHPPSAAAGDTFVSSDAPPKRAGAGRKALSSSVDDISG